MSNLLRIICIAATAFFLVSCSSTPSRWHLNGKSQQELNERHSFCDQFAANNAAPAMMYGGNPYSALASLISLSGQTAGVAILYESCMNEGGFNKVK